MNKIVPLFLTLLLTGCASYQTKVSTARNHLANGRASEAAKELEPLAEKEGDDQLVYLLDYATALQAAGRYDESTKAFLKAGKIAEVKDYHSLSRVVGSLVLNEGLVQYKGEDYEKLLINVFLAQNFLMKGDLDGALVETRRLDQILNKYRVEAKRDYEQNAFAVYLSAMIWESDRKWDDAYIAYKQVHKLNSGISLIGKDLLRSARAAQRPDELAKWKASMPSVRVDEWVKDKKMGEVVLIYQQGKAPVKRPHPDAHRFPKLFAAPSSTRTARLEIAGKGSAVTEKIYSIQDVAIKTLDDAYAGLVAKRAAGIAAKVVISDQVRQKNEALGLITWIGLNLADQADLRQWSTLPETFQVARIPVMEGTYKISVQGLDLSGAPTSEHLPKSEIFVKGGRKTFMLWRSFN